MKTIRLILLFILTAPAIAVGQSLSQSWCGLCFDSARKLYQKKKDRIDYVYQMCYKQAIFPEEESQCRKDYWEAWVKIRVEQREDKYDCWEWICGGNAGSTNEYDTE